jgi:guanylate kinase
MFQGKIIFFTAPSGSGKTTIVRHLLAQNPQLCFSISATTRGRRPNEEHGRDYYYLSRADFEAKIAEQAFVEYEEVYEGLYYGTLRSEIERIWSQGKHVIIDIDVKGGQSIKRSYPEQSLGVFIRLRSLEVLEERLRRRGTESEEQLQKRLQRAAYEISFAGQFDQVLVNDDLEEAKLEAARLVEAFLGTGLPA